VAADRSPSFTILLTGMVIDLALMPVALFHFHRAGIYGAMANLVAISDNICFHACNRGGARI
jgi:predicted membrane metal-binding protein